MTENITPKVQLVNTDKQKHGYCYTKNCICTLASHPKSVYWHPILNGNIVPGDVALGSTKLYWFKCEECGHNIRQSANHIQQNRWCKYCSDTKWNHCGDKTCKWCYDKSFASVEKSKYWDIDKNGITPYEVAKKSDKICYFKCNVCSHSFKSYVHNITRNLSWCPFCSSTNWHHCGNDSCNWCFNRSFKSTDKYKFWHPTKNQDINPLYVSKYNDKKYWFLCECGHSFFASPQLIHSGCWCVHCSVNNWKHCRDNDCKMCFQRSFKSTEKAKYWHPTKNGNIDPLYLAKRAKKNCWFQCDKCLHSFDILLDTIYTGSWCKYCSTTNWKHCGIDKCEWCFNRSFAKDPRSKFLKDKTIDPLRIAPFSHSKYTFVCDDCSTEFLIRIADISKGNWCPSCKFKTEKKLLYWLQEKYDVIKSAKFDWCKSLETKLHFPFDFYLPDYKLILELDGDQHFKQVSNWTSSDDTQKRDIYKMQRAIEKGLRIIRIYQEDVYRNRNSWESQLQHAIETIDKNVLCIRTKKDFVNMVYDKYDNMINTNLLESEI